MANQWAGIDRLNPASFVEDIGIILSMGTLLSFLWYHYNGIGLCGNMISHWLDTLASLLEALNNRMQRQKY